MRETFKAANLNVTLRIILSRHFTTGDVAFWGRASCNTRKFRHRCVTSPQLRSSRIGNGGGSENLYLVGAGDGEAAGCGVAVGAGAGDDPAGAAGVGAAAAAAGAGVGDG